MNPVEVLLNHKTIREFKMTPVPGDQLRTLLEISKRTATSMGMQTYSVIRITDKELKARIANEVCGQEYVARFPELLIFIVDAYRNYKIAEQQGAESLVGYSPYTFFQGFTDASLAAQNLVAAAELGGYGTVYLGSILNNAPKLIELLELPKLTFPVIGVGLGVPNQKPQLKPRIPMEYTVFDNSYKTFDDYLEALAEYDAEMTEYYDTRSMNQRSDSFTKQVATKMGRRNQFHETLGEQIRAQGFTL